MFCVGTIADVHIHTSFIGQAWPDPRKKRGSGNLCIPNSGLLYGFGWGSLEGLVTSHATAATRGKRWKSKSECILL